jgi:hypothetical protein
MGRASVDLRDFQEDILNTLGEEVWLDFLNDVGPLVRNFILLSSRQIGKCQLFNTQIVIKNTLTGNLYTISIGELYNMIKAEKIKLSRKQQLISKLKSFFYKIFHYVDKKC